MPRRCRQCRRPPPGCPSRLSARHRSGQNLTATSSIAAVALGYLCVTKERNAWPAPRSPSRSMPSVSLTGAMAMVLACILAPSAYTLLSISGMAPMTVPIFLGWLVWLQLVHVAAGGLIWRQREHLSTRMKAALLSWGGLAFWYWLPAPIYFLLTMNLDRLQLQWTALAFFWEVPVVGGAFVLAAQRLYPSRRRLSTDPARRYREVMRYPTLVGSLLFAFTLLGYAIGALQLRLFAALPLVEQIKNVGNGVVISLLLAVFYHLGLDRVLEPARSQIAGEGLPADEFSAETRGRVTGGGRGIVHDSRRDLKVVGFVDAPRLGGTLVGVAFHTDAYGALRAAARLLALAGAFVLTVTVGMLVFASRASTRAVRALSSAVRRVEAGQVDDTVLRIDTGDEIGELSAVVERYVRRSRDLSENLQEKVREQTQELSATAHRLEALQHIDRSILAAESAEAIARNALPRLRQIVPYR